MGEAPSYDTIHFDGNIIDSTPIDTIDINSALSNATFSGLSNQANLLQNIDFNRSCNLEISSRQSPSTSQSVEQSSQDLVKIDNEAMAVEFGQLFENNGDTIHDCVDIGDLASIRTDNRFNDECLSFENFEYREVIDDDSDFETDHLEEETVRSTREEAVNINIIITRPVAESVITLQVDTSSSVI